MAGIGMKSNRTLAIEKARQGESLEWIAAFLGVDLEKVREWVYGKPRTPLKAAAAGSKPKPKKRRTISAASPAQRRKVKELSCIVTGQDGADPAHIWPRSLGGCDDPLCVVPLARIPHDEYDRHERSILAELITHGYVAELQHALGHANGDLIGLLQQVDAQRWIPAKDAA